MARGAGDGSGDDEPQDICDQCGLLLADDRVRFAVVADSSAVHDDSDRLDGQRIVLGTQVPPSRQDWRRGPAEQ